MSKDYYITTTLPYVNADPHIGFALEIVQADVLARYKKSEGFNVVFNTGTDEHGLKIYRRAVEEGKDPKKYVDEHAAKFEKLKKALNLSYTDFIRTTDPHHIKAAQKFWKLCDKNGDIYKKNYQIKYCVGCELEKTESELVDNCCPIHPNLKLEIIEEENYFFRFSRYQDKLLQLYEKYPDFVVPDFRLNEIKQFVKGGLQDFSISRVKEKLPWGVPVPGDETQVMYVWFDALINYISTLGWPFVADAPLIKPSKFELYWGTKEKPNAVQVAGKDNLRQQSAMWQAMLMSAGLPSSRKIMIHGFITSNGQKMSKSLGNVVDPYEVVEKYGTDALRYWLLAKADPFEDSDFTWEKFKKDYNSDLANGLGNLVARVAKLAEKIGFEVVQKTEIFDLSVKEKLEEYEFNEAIDIIWVDIAALDKRINEVQPWKLEEEKLKEFLSETTVKIRSIALSLKPFLPETAEKIEKQFTGSNIKSSQPLFPRAA
ncbi:methionine--tRNA ligase [Candidatus Parcubacteria bacterium]|nr:MAG: methionine--tRNA ligase [Candidatus Parcubacteria bacterium]